MIMVQVGDWVKVKMWGYYLIGFVEYVWKESIQITKVFRVEDGKVQRISQRHGTYDPSQVEPLPCDIHPDDIGTLIDIALDTKDEEWFRELTERVKPNYESSKTV
jgi:hypothetical protein